jgi:hypothetical protein
MMVLVEGHWIGVKDGDPRAVALYKRHYSARQGADWLRYGFSGKGESMVLITADCKALFGWRKVEGEGVNCFVFRNEGDVLSSGLISEAMALAWQRWPDERLYTYVNPRIVQGDGKCFKAAGWTKLRGRTQKLRLITLEINQDNAKPKHD